MNVVSCPQCNCGGLQATPQNGQSLLLISGIGYTERSPSTIERLLSALEGEAKKSVESIDCEGIFYATALKSSKRDFGNPVLVTHLKIKSIFDQPQIKSNDKIGLRKYHHQVKITNTWLLSMGYENPILSYENLSKAVTRLPNYLQTQFFKAT